MHPTKFRALIVALIAAAVLLPALSFTPASTAAPADEQNVTAAKARPWQEWAKWDFDAEEDKFHWHLRDVETNYRHKCSLELPKKEDKRSLNFSGPGVVTQAGGYLRLGVEQIACKKFSGKNIKKDRVLYRSGHVATDGTFPLLQPNVEWKIMARIRFPKSKGNHAALWTRGLAEARELDIAESFGPRWSGKCRLQTNFYFDYDPDGDTSEDKKFCLDGKPNVPGETAGKWHYYRANVIPGVGAKIYINGRKVAEFSGRHTPDTESFLLLSNLVNDCKRGVCGKRVNTTGPDADMLIDYVHVYVRPKA